MNDSLLDVVEKIVKKSRYGSQKKGEVRGIQFCVTGM